MACQNYQRGLFAASALNILQAIEELPEIHIVWVSGRESLDSDRTAHATACAYIHQAITRERQSTLAAAIKTEPLPQYTGILASYRHGRRKFLPPSPLSPRKEATALEDLG